MAREIDLRDPNINRLTPEREAALREEAEKADERLADREGIEEVKITRFDPLTGNPAAIEFEVAAAPRFSIHATGTGEGASTEGSEGTAGEHEGPPAQGGQFVQRALIAAHRLRPTLGQAPSRSAAFESAREVQDTTSGAHAVHLRQTYKGIPIFDATQTVRFNPAGELAGLVGHSVTITRDMPAIPTIPVEEAALIAARHVATPSGGAEPTRDPFGEPIPQSTVDLSGFTPRVTRSFRAEPTRPTVLTGGPFAGVIPASLIWFPLSDEVRLAWDLRFTLPDETRRYRVLVDAQDGTILYAHELT